MQQNEQELSLKKRARRRLVGALALVLLMVIFLPMLLKNPAAPLQPDNEVKITLTQENTAEVEGVIENLPEKTQEITQQETPIEAQEKLVEPAKTIEKPVQVEAPEPAKTVPKPTKSNNETSTTNTNTNKFYVQIGVFSEMPNVKQLQNKLTDLGYSSSTEKINTEKGTKIRLRTKTFDSRNEAAIALQNIKDAGLTGMVVSQ